MEVIEAQTRLEAWIEGADLLLDRGFLLNLSLSIVSPSNDGPEGLQARHRIDDFYLSEDEDVTHTVAETIFPGWEYKRRGLSGVFEHYPSKEYPQILKHPANRWGTYAHRLVRRATGSGETINPLERTIDKMHTQLNRRGGTNRSCYELGIAEGEYDLPLYSTAADDTRHMGGPCLSHLSFKLLDGSVHLTAFYRSHDYRYKVPGNLLGLARLQACVAKETGQEIGTLVVHSSYAYLRGSKKRMRALLSDVRPMTHVED